MSTIPACEVFAAGTHRGKTYTLRDLRDMADNLNRYQIGPRAALRVPAVLGHEENQELLERTDLPAAAWGAKARVAGDKLLVDFSDVPPKVAQLLRGRRYRKVSAEVYDEPPEGVPGKGKMLRRVAFLGGEIPQIKNLDDIPLPEPHSERFAPVARHVFMFTEVKRSTTPGAFWVFSERVETAMNPDEQVQDNPAGTISRDDIIARLQEHGLDAETLREVPDEALAEMLRVCEDKDAGQETPEDPDAEFAADDESMPPTPEGDDQARDYAERARKYACLAKKYSSFKKNAEPGPAVEQGPNGPQQVTRLDHAGDHSQQSRQPQSVTMKFTEEQLNAKVARAVEQALSKHVQGSLDQLQKFAEETTASQKRAAVEAFCEAESKAGRIPPAELDRANPANLFDRLMRADSKAPVHKYREKGKDVALTELDLQMQEVRQRRPIKFTEKAKDGTGKTGKDVATSDRKAWAETTYSKFSESFKAAGVQKSTLVENAEKADDDAFLAMQREWDGLSS